MSTKKRACRICERVLCIRSDGKCHSCWNAADGANFIPSCPPEESARVLKEAQAWGVDWMIASEMREACIEQEVDELKGAIESLGLAKPYRVPIDLSGIEYIEAKEPKTDNLATLPSEADTRASIQAWLKSNVANRYQGKSPNQLITAVASKLGKNKTPSQIADDAEIERVYAGAFMRYLEKIAAQISMHPRKEWRNIFAVELRAHLEKL